MLDLQAAAKLARERDTKRLDEASGQKDPPSLSATAVQKQSDFRTRILESFRRSSDERQGPHPPPDALFLAFAEKIIPKWGYLAFGPLRKAKSQAMPSPAQTTDASKWTRWDQTGIETRFANLSQTRAKGILIAHGLSPLADCTCLLADIGRAARASIALGVPLHALLADVTWMSYNRSVRRFNLDEKTIGDGLRLCLDHRGRLYTALGIAHTVHKILSYEKKGTIHAEKIQHIAQRYQELTSSLWGDEYFGSDDPLTTEQVAKIGRPLIHSLGPNSPLYTLSRFPGALGALETALKPHLDIIRALTKRFRVLSVETFSYYFAQYYAQASYRGGYIKVCPVSERDFDEPFDELDESFRSWGDGHEVAISQVTARKARRVRMAAIYLPHYQMGSWKVLPYSPLSLDALVKSERDVSNVVENLLLISDNDQAALAKANRIVRETKNENYLQLNRLCADITSFIAWYIRGSDSALVGKACKALGIESLGEVLSRLDSGTPKWFEIECERHSDWPRLWLTWLDSVESGEKVEYMPTHISIACKTEEDWDESALEAAAQLLVIANYIGSELSS